jgi:hypothetical protein
MFYTYEELMALSREELADDWTKVSNSSLIINDILEFDAVLNESEDTDPEK